MIRYYNNDITQPTAQYIDFHFYESTDELGRFVFRNKLTGIGRKGTDLIVGGYALQKDKIRYYLNFEKKRYSNGSKLLWILRNDKPWPTYDNGKHLFVDHIDGNTENNFISNIRPATNQQNQFNSKKQSNSTSGYKGVTWKKERSKWKAHCQYNGKEIFLGYYDSKEEAALAYNTKAAELFGDYVRLNVLS